MTRRAGLGRGLDALLPAAAEGLEERSALEEVAVELLQANPRQPRSRFDPGALDELTASVRRLGVLQPLLARRLPDGRLELIAGERRLRAAKAAGRATVPVLVVSTDDEGALERALVENVHRSNLNPIEEAAAVRQLIDDGGLTQEELGERLGRNRASIANQLRLLELPDGIKRLLIDGLLTAGHGKALLGLQGNPMQERLARRAAHEGLSVRETEERVRQYQALSASGPRPAPGARAVPEEAIDTQRRLADHLQTRVRVEIGKRKGKIVLDFVSLDELDRLTRTILGDDPTTQTTVTPR